MKGSSKLWIGVNIIVFILILFNTNFKEVKALLFQEGISINEVSILSLIGAFTIFLVLAFFIVLQLLGICLLIDADGHYSSHNICSDKVPPEIIPQTTIGYFQIPVMAVKFIKIINRWADKNL